jgi:hypothetical protein
MRREHLDSAGAWWASLHVESGPGMTLWSHTDSMLPRSAADISFELQPQEQVVITAKNS